MQAYVALGRIDRAFDAALEMQTLDEPGQLSGMIIFAAAARNGDWAGVLSELDAGMTVGPLFDGLIRGWAQVGSGGDGRRTEDL